MAKAKKSESGEKTAAKAKTPVKNDDTAVPKARGANQTAAKGKPAEKTKSKADAAPTKAPGHASASAPLIDTSLAADSAARFLVAGIHSKKPQQGSTRPESALFKQLKSGLNKPASGMNTLLDKTHGPSQIKGHGHSKQVGHNQTIGSDAARKNVPRRTAG